MLGTNEATGQVSIFAEPQPGTSVELELPAGVRWAMAGVRGNQLLFHDGQLSFSTQAGATIDFEDGFRLVTGRSRLTFINNRPDGSHSIVVAPLLGLKWGLSSGTPP